MRPDENDDELLAAIETVLTSHPSFRERSVLVTGYVVMVELSTSDGEQLLFFATPEHQRAHRTLGLIEYARLHKHADVMNDDEGDD